MKKDPYVVHTLRPGGRHNTTELSTEHKARNFAEHLFESLLDVSYVSVRSPIGLKLAAYHRNPKP